MSGESLATGGLTGATGASIATSGLIDGQLLGADPTPPVVPAGNTTTLTEILDNYRLKLEALVPVRFTDKPFRRARRRTLLRDTIRTNPGSGAFRWFEFLDDGTPTMPVTMDPRQYLRIDDVTLLVAYPDQMGLYGDEDVDSLEDISYRDAAQLHDCLLNPDNYITGQNGCLPEVGALERTGDVWIRTIRMRVHYFKAISVG